MSKAQHIAALLLVTTLLLAPAPVLAAVGSGELETVPIPEAYDVIWLDELDLWLSNEERSVYLSLSSQGHREAFRQAFWHSRDRTPNLQLNEVKEHFLHHLTAVRHRGLPLADPRSRAMLLYGSPQVTVALGECGREADNQILMTEECLAAPTFELFSYHDGSPVGEGPVLFVQDQEQCKLYRDDFDPPFQYVNAPPLRCKVGLLDKAMRAQLGWPAMEESGLRYPAVGPWLSEFRRSRDDVASATVDPISVRVVQQEELEPEANWLLHLVIDVPVAPGWWSTPLPWRFLRARIDLFQGDRRLAQFDHFVTQLADPGAALRIPISIEIPVGAHTLVFHVEDESAVLYSSAAFALEVPRSTVAGEKTRSTLRATKEPDSVSVDGNSLSLATRVAAQPWISIESSEGLVLGERPVQLESWGGEIARVEYLLGGSLVGWSELPPFVAAIDFGPLPGESVLLARAFDASGRQVAVDRSPINPGIHKFEVKLVDLTPERPQTLMIRGAISVPLGSQLERVELFEEDRLVALYEDARFRFTRPAKPAESQARGATLLRAVAHLRDGRTSEDSLLVTGRFVEEVDVALVEVFAAITNRHGRPLRNLKREEVTILENGVGQTIGSFQHLDQLPINVVLLLDTSITMANEIEQVRESGLAFLEQVIREDDQAALLSFNHRTYVVVPFTNDLQLLREGSQSLRTWGGTSLHDSVVLALHYLHGLQGKRALILVSDGVEESSDTKIEQLLEYAQRVGAATYAIGLGQPRGDSQDAAAATERLQQIATRTGGAYYRLKGSKQLNRVYEEIEADLRSQYLLTYESGAGPEAGADYRTIRVEVARRAAMVRARPGYYP